MAVFDLWRQHVRYPVRSLVRDRGFTVAAILMLGLGVGANVAMFSVLYAVVLKPLPYTSPIQLVLIRAETTVPGTRRPLPMSVFLRDLEVWKRAQTFDHPALYIRATHSLSTQEGREHLDDALVSTEFFETMSGRFVAGRPLATEDDVTPTCVIS